MCGFVFQRSDLLEIEVFKRALKSIDHRGPDSSITLNVKGANLGFNRLSIMDLSHQGDQPFKFEDTYFMCNGEIYNYQELKEEYSEFTYQSGSDCEVLIPLYLELGIERMVLKLDAEYAFVIYDEREQKVFAARDPIGIRPLFYGVDKTSKQLCFASEVKALKEFCTNIKPFPPGHYFDGEFHCYLDIAQVERYHSIGLEDIYDGINKYLTQAVEKRLQSDAPVGFLLSGGLDSSLVCAIAARMSDKKIKTFSIGMSEDAIDLKYAKIVAEHIGADHTEVIITKDDVLSALPKVVYQLETWDITTIRASIGMYLVCEHIKKHTDIKVLLTGEVSDEIFGYKYTDFAPNGDEFQKEAMKRVRELYVYDVLRADRCISAHSLEARVPFSDQGFVQFVMGIAPELKMNHSGHGKYLLRKAFESGDYLPESILWREKAAFSDAVGHSMVDYLKEYAESLYSDEEFQKKSRQYIHKAPFTKESLMYRDLFESHYPKMSELIFDYWMPNKEWKNCNVADPSARVLPNYGTSGK